MAPTDFLNYKKFTMLKYMKRQKWYEIDDIDDFIKNLRVMVLGSFFKHDQKQEDIFHELFKSKEKELDKKLSLKEAYAIIEPMVEKGQNPIGKDEYLISDKIFVKMIENLNKRIISNLLLDLVKAGKIDSAFDEEKNDFIFWPKDQPK